MRWSGQDVGRCRRICVFISITRAADLDDAQTQRVELGDAKLERFRIAARRPGARILSVKRLWPRERM